MREPPCPPRNDLRGVRGVVFDMDGTLIHSHIDFTRMNGKAIAAMTALGVPDEVLDPEQHIATNYAVGRHHFLRTRGESLMTHFEETVNRALIDVELEQVPTIRPVEGALETVDGLIDDGYGVGVLTRASRTYALQAMRHSGLLDRFEVIVCRDDYPEEESKPDPRALRNTARLMGIRAEECLMLGDHLMDMRCALQAGARFLGVLTGSYDMNRWKEAGQERLIESVASLGPLSAGKMTGDQRSASAFSAHSALQ